MPPRLHLTTAPHRDAAVGAGRTQRTPLRLVGGREVDEREAAARAASMARHPAGNRASLAAEQRAASLARHPAGGARHPLG
jgi:hypothetical protein